MLHGCTKLNFREKYATCRAQAFYDADLYLEDPITRKITKARFKFKLNARIQQWMLEAHFCLNARINAWWVFCQDGRGYKKGSQFGTVNITHLGILAAGSENKMVFVPIENPERKLPIGANLARYDV